MMERKDIQEMLATMQAIFPNYKPENKTVAVSGWLFLLQNEKKEDVYKAFEIFCKTDTKGFAPNPAQLLKIIREMESETIAGGEAWAIVRKGLKNGIYGSKEEFAKMPEVIQRSIGTPGTLREWAMMETEVIESVIMSQFLKSYATVSKRMQMEKYAPEIKPEKMLEAESVEKIEQREEHQCTQMSDELREKIEKKLGKF